MSICFSSACEDVAKPVLRPPIFPSQTTFENRRLEIPGGLLKGQENVSSRHFSYFIFSLLHLGKCSPRDLSREFYGVSKKGIGMLLSYKIHKSLQGSPSEVILERAEYKWSSYHGNWCLLLVQKQQAVGATWKEGKETRKPMADLVVVVVQLLSRVLFFVTPWTAARQAFLSFTISWSLLKLMSIESVMPSNHLIFCHPFSPLALKPSQHQGLLQ